MTKCESIINFKGSLILLPIMNLYITQWTRKFKKVLAKKFREVNSIFCNFKLGIGLKLPKCNVTKFFFIYLISRVFLPGLIQFFQIRLLYISMGYVSFVHYVASEKPLNAIISWREKSDLNANQCCWRGLVPAKNWWGSLVEQSHIWNLIE